MQPLTPVRSQVLSGLLAGQPIAAVARANGIDRSTIYHWRRDHPHFTFALDQARARLQTALYDDVQDLVSQALEVLADSSNSTPCGQPHESQHNSTLRHQCGGPANQARPIPGIPHFSTHFNPRKTVPRPRRSHPRAQPALPLPLRSEIQEMLWKPRLKWGRRPRLRRTSRSAFGKTQHAFILRRNTHSRFIFLTNSPKRGSERSGSSSGSTLRNPSRKECSANAWLSRAKACSLSPSAT